MRSLTALLLVNFGVVTHYEPDILRQTGTCSLSIHISSRECTGHINLHVILMMVSVWLKWLNVCIMTEIFIYLLHVLTSVSLLLVTIWFIIFQRNVLWDISFPRIVTKKTKMAKFVFVWTAGLCCLSFYLPSIPVALSRPWYIRLCYRPKGYWFSGNLQRITALTVYRYQLI